MGTVAVTEMESAFQKEYSADLVSLVRWILGAEEEDKYDLEKLQATFHHMFHAKLAKRWGKSSMQHAAGERKVRKLPEVRLCEEARVLDSAANNTVASSSQICPRLHALLSSPTPPSFRLPSTSGFVEVVSVEPKVEVVESKTCPKKITFKER